MAKNNCGPEPNKAFQRAKWLQWQACKSGAPLAKGFGERPKNSEKKGPKFE